MNMDQANGDQHLQEGEPLIRDEHDEPEEGRLLVLILGREHDIYACNHCKDYVRGGVITICGHLFCWTCLWPLLANKQFPTCPRCQTDLLLHEDIMPFYGEGPNARPEDGNVLAEPGSVPRPAGICLNRPGGNEAEYQDLEQDEQIIVPDQLFIGRRPPALIIREIGFEEALPQIDFTLKCLKWIQQVCVIILCLIWCFQPHT